MTSGIPASPGPGEAVLQDRVSMHKRDTALPEPFCYYKTILNSDHLHFGLWPEDNAGLSTEKAQENMFNSLVSFFPPPPAEVLDVGCGLGVSAYLLSRKGYRVTAIAPSREMIRYASQTYGESGVKFVETGFFDECDEVFSQERYDVILFQESAQYVSPLHKLIEKARELLRGDGFLIIGDEVCYDESIRSETAVHSARDFSVALAETGFCIIENRKVGKNIFPTYDFVIEGLKNNSERIVAECAGEDTQEKLHFYIAGWSKQKEWNAQGKMGYEIIVARKNDFFIRTYMPGDEDEILAMFREVFRVDRGLEHWLWKFRDNPYGSYEISQAFSKEGRLVTHYSTYPVPFWNGTGIGPRTFLSHHGGDTMTRAEVRNVGMGKTNLLSRTAHHFFAKYLEGQTPFAYGFNTGKIKVLGKRYLGYNYFDEVVFRVKDIAKELIQKPRIPRILSKFKVEDVRSFTAEWDDFFERVSSSYRLLVRRDCRYLSWRYSDPEKEYKIFSIRSGGKLLGWSVFLKKEERLIWGDALFDSECPEAVTRLLDYVQNSLLGRGSERIEGWFSRHPEWWHNILDKAGFDVEEEPNHLSFCYKIFDQPDMTAALFRDLYYSQGDSDLF